MAVEVRVPSVLRSVTGGEKIVRTQREIDMKDTTATAKAAPAEQPAKKPTMRRPGDPDPELQPSQQP